jgi:hypothetical protein
LIHFGQDHFNWHKTFEGEPRKQGLYFCRDLHCPEKNLRNQAKSPQSYIQWQFFEARFFLIFIPLAGVWLYA